MLACDDVRHASARLASFIDQFIASLDQRLQFYKLLAGQFGCLLTLSPEELQLPRHPLIHIKMISTIAKFADIGLFKDDEPGNISKEIFLYKVIIDKGVHDTIPNVAIALRM